jgi:hypothetical protein
LIQVIHHALGVEVLPHKLLSTFAETPAQGGILNQAQETFSQAKPVAWPHQETGLIIKAYFVGSVGIVGYHRSGSGKRLGQGAR